MKKKKVKATYDTTSTRFGFHEWNLKSGEQLFRELEEKLEEWFEAHVQKMVKEALEIATAEYQCYAGFAIEENRAGLALEPNPQSLDPTTIRVSLPLGPDDGSNPEWTFTLTEVVDFIIVTNEEADGGPLDPNMKPTFEQIRDGLRGLADTIDAALARPRTSGEQAAR